MPYSEFIADFFGIAEGGYFFCSLPNERGKGQPIEICGRGTGQYLEEKLDRWNLPDRGTFFCVNTLTPKQGRRSKETVHEIVCLHADIDWSKVKAPPATILERLNSLPCLPSRVINSGHGHHVYYLLNEPLAATPDTVAKVEGLLRKLANVVGGDPAVCEVARIMRLPGSYNTKNGDRLPVSVIINRPNRYELDDLAEWLSEQRQIIEPVGAAVVPTNPYLAVAIPGASGEPVDVDARLDAMTFQGGNGASIHHTQLAVSAALLNRGTPIDEIVNTVLAATRRAAGARGERWNWDQEARDVRAMCGSWDKKQVTRAKQFARTNAEVLSNKEFKPVHFLVPDLIPAEGIALLCSKPKVGKSWLLLDLCLSCTVDRDVFGDRRPLQGHCLYLALEDSERRLQSRINKLLPVYQQRPATLELMTDHPRVDQGGLEMIRDWVNEVRAAGGTVACIAIDVLKQIRPAGQEKKSAYDRDYEAVAGLRSLAHDLGVAIIIAHHTRKLAGEDLQDNVSGTLALAGSVDTVIVIERQSGGYVFDVRGRDVEAVTLAATFHKETCRWSIGGEASTTHRTTEREVILRLFREAKEPLSVEAVCDLLVTAKVGDSSITVTNSRSSVKQILARMCMAGDLKREKRGVYELPHTH